MRRSRTGRFPGGGDLWRSGDPSSSRRHRFPLGPGAEADPRTSRMSRAKGSSRRRTSKPGLTAPSTPVDTSPWTPRRPPPVHRGLESKSASRLRICRLRGAPSGGLRIPAGHFPNTCWRTGSRPRGSFLVRRSGGPHALGGGIVLRLNDRKKVNG